MPSKAAPMESANPSFTLIDFLGRFRAALVILSG